MKSSISRASWLEAASFGSLSLLNRWHQDGMLRIRRASPSSQPTSPLFDVCDDNRNTALHYAISHVKDEYAQRLLGLARCPSTRNNEGKTPLWVAAERGNASIMKMLIEAGHKAPPDKKGVSLLAAAVKSGNLDAFKLALGISQAQKDDNAMEEAIRARNDEMVQLLLDHGADPNMMLLQRHCPLLLVGKMWEKTDVDQQTPLSRILVALIKAGADPDAKMKDENGFDLELRSAVWAGDGDDFMNEIGRIRAIVESTEINKATAKATASSTRIRL